ncbi:MAG: 50S ribosomal protein L23 [Planctomycetes bacterium]|nr:50S ribosomal protein L23 [Planctomycetota bacterium]
MRDSTYNVIIKPLITEKGTYQNEVLNAYSFQVATWANKIQIRRAVESIYNVKVLSVRTSMRKGKPRRIRWNQWGATKHWKKAVVVLHPDYHIDLF